MKPEQLVTETAKHLTAIEPHLKRTLENLSDWGGLGYPTGRGAPGGDGTSTTERAALGTLERNERDRFATDRANLVAAITEGEAAFARARKIISETRETPRDPVTNKPVVAPREGCAPCSNVKDPVSGQPHENGYQDVYTRRPRPSNGEGPKVAYCQWHAGWMTRWNTEPPDAIVAWHLDHPGTKVPSAMVKDHMPEAWARDQAQRARPLGVANLGLKETA